MIFQLKPEVAAAVGTRAANEANEAMRALTAQQLPEAAVGAKLALQRALFDLVPAPKETEQEP